MLAVSGELIRYIDGVKGRGVFPVGCKRSSSFLEPTQPTIQLVPDVNSPRDKVVET
jgi:hypothetical protein